MNTAQKIIKNIFSLFFSGVVAQVLALIVIVYLARVLGPENFGKINFAFAIITYFILIANLGLPIFGTREIARDKERVNEYSGNILSIRLSLSVLGYLLLYLFTVFLNKPQEIKYLIMIYGLGLISAALFLDWAFQGVQKMEYIGIGRILIWGGYAGLVFLFVKSPNQLFLIPCFQVAGSFLGAGVLLSIFIRHYGPPRFKLNLISWQNIIRQALPIGLAGSMVQVIYYIDTIMLGFMKSNEAVGYYNAAYKIIFLFVVTAGVYFNSIFPVMSNYYKNKKDSLIKLQYLSIKLLITIVLPLGICGTLFSKPIINLIYGAQYNEAVMPFQILVWSVVFMCIGSSYAWALWACDRQTKYLKVVSIQAVWNLVLNLFLIPRVGLIGAAISKVVAEFIGIPLYYREFCKVVQVPFHGYIIKPLFSSLIVFLLVYFGLHKLNLNMIFLIISGAFIYIAIFYLLKGISKEEMKIFKSIVLANRR